MGKNKYVDLFKDMIPAVDSGIRELWDAACDNGKKEIKGDFWTLNRYISAVKTSNRELKEHYVVTVNEFYNKNWALIQKHPQLVWQTLCCCSAPDKSPKFHEWISVKQTRDKKTEFLLKLFPDMSIDDVESLAKVTTTEQIKEYCRDLGWEKKEINGIKF